MLEIKDFSFIDTKVIYCHPNNVKLLEDNIQVLKDPNVFYPYSHKFIKDNGIPQFKETWSPPYDRFIEYEAKDEEWMRPLGIGVKKEPVFYFKN
jgi:hypothetical protein